MALIDKLTAIGDAIREKTGSSELIPLPDMPNEIDAVYEAGKKSEYDAFWDAYQDKGKYKMSHYMFAGNGWNDKTFKPKYPILFRYGCSYVFAYSLMTDIVASLKAQGVTLDTKEASDLKYLCFGMASKTFPTLDTTGIANRERANMRGLFYSATKLERIEKIITSENVEYWEWFYRCESLRDVTFEGVVGRDIDFRYSTLLSKASIENIIGCLSDTASGKTLTLSRAAVESAFADTNEWDTLIAAKTNWTITLI